jgi:alpha-beta hydrolase superfamily lysophospholipase
LEVQKNIRQVSEFETTNRILVQNIFRNAPIISIDTMEPTKITEIIDYLTKGNVWRNTDNVQGITYEEKSIKLSNTTFFTRSLTTNSCIASVVLFHGYGESSQDYGHIASLLNSYGLDVFMFDQFGHGKSFENMETKEHTFSKDYFDLVSFGMQYIEYLDKVHQIFKSPVFLLGQAMGATTILHIMNHYNWKHTVAGAILLSPAFVMSKAPGNVRETLFVGLSTMTGGYWGSGERVKLEPSEYSDLKDVQVKIGNDELRHFSVSGNAGYAIISMGRDAMALASNFHCPFLIVQGSKDKVTNLSATQDFVKTLTNCKSKKFVEYTSGSHSLLYSSCIWEIEGLILNWLEKRIEEITPIDEMKDKVDHLLSTFERVKGELNANSQKISDLEKENKELTSKWSDFITSSVNSTVLNQKLAEENSQLNNLVKELEGKISMLTQELNVAKEKQTSSKWSSSNVGSTRGSSVDVLKKPGNLLDEINNFRPQVLKQVKGNVLKPPLKSSNTP